MVRSNIITLATINCSLMDIASEKKKENERTKINISCSFRAVD